MVGAGHARQPHLQPARRSLGGCRAARQHAGHGPLAERADRRQRRLCASHGALGQVRTPAGPQRVGGAGKRSVVRRQPGRAARASGRLPARNGRRFDPLLWTRRGRLLLVRNAQLASVLFVARRMGRAGATSRAARPGVAVGQPRRFAADSGLQQLVAPRRCACHRSILFCFNGCGRRRRLGGARRADEHDSPRVHRSAARACPGACLPRWPVRPEARCIRGGPSACWRRRA
mmetsp:Transcript_3932/g.16361  ORF Transcript_3932/g.16361 Transcript_3932/m.16361 type:complete len:232 (-) Transcript_3932:679-1374(-)